ncbi:MAG: hypothetical protein SFX19_01890 [Alphaproteobacteria bacterium]|nr:hypothetical protein [Alphaproteobacteria bacterium]
MSRNTQQLQKRAAEYLLSGYNVYSTAEELGVRYSTVMRWYNAPVFLAHVARLKSIRKKEFEINLLRMATKAINDINGHLDNSGGITQSCGAINMLKNIYKCDIFPDETPENQSKSVETSLKSVETSSEPVETSLKPVETGPPPA